MKILFLLAERNNKIIHIDELTPDENGLKCNCICPICKEPLKANTLGKIKRKHFSHNKNSDCINYLETAIHKLAKQIIEDNKRIVIPRLNYNYETLVEEQNINFETVESEIYLSDHSFKPDIIGTTIHKNKKIDLIIEIAVTHKIDDIKFNKIKNSNISTIEIYLDPKALLNLSLNEIKDKVINSTSNKKWIFNRVEANKIKSYKEKLQQEMKARLDKEKLKLKNQQYYVSKNIYRGKSFFEEKKYEGFVYKCPRSTLEYHDKRISDIDECNNCIYFYGFVKEGFIKKSVKCKGKYGFSLPSPYSDADFE